ncbi:MAG: hypothetical protein JWR19_4342 [Pedosphaera sp.]|jgi:hypothetical protein|nr:hypothetical protein [Pedosphaera sp.]
MRKLTAVCIGLLFAPIPSVLASENLPAKPFAQAVWLPEQGQWLVTPWYQYTEFENVWRGSQKENITVKDHGFDQNDGMVLTEYGIKQNWAADLLLGYTSLATRSFSTPPGTVQTTAGIMDVTFGLRWQVLNETNTTCKYTPTLTLRAGGIYHGSYHGNFPFAPGNDSVGVEPSVLLSKNFGWDGFGMYGNLGYRHMRSGGNSQIFGSVGLSQRYNGFNFNGGYRHQQDTGGVDIGGSGNTIIYTPKAKEYNQYYEVGVGYTDHRAWHYQFYLAQNFNGRNTGDKTIYGIYFTMPFGGHKAGADQRQ